MKFNFLGMKIPVFWFVMFVPLLAAFSGSNKLYKINVTDGSGKEVKMRQYKGKVLLVVNTATQCGYTPQYEELERLYRKYKTQGLEILDFPCNQFGEQAPGSYEEIHSFCTGRYHITFPQMQKIEVNGANEHPLYKYLKRKKGFEGFDLNHPKGKRMDAMLRAKDPEYDKKDDIKWNFTKFLINKNGRVVERYEPYESIDSIAKDIERLL